MKQLACVLVLLMFGVVSHGQTTYNSDGVRAVRGIPSTATFAFIKGYNVPGATELILQCAGHRAWLIVDYDEYGGQQSSQAFTINCTTVVNPDGSQASTLNGTPFTVPLTLTGYGSPRQINLTVTYANWLVVYCNASRWGCSSGMAQITY